MIEGNASLQYILQEGSARFSAGNYSGAIALWVPLLEALDSSEVSGNPPLQQARISTLVNCGAALRALGDVSGAMNAYSMAIRAPLKIALSLAMGYD
jgi:cytochrome c-type biogenesis protein CcmH/NrfG